MPKDKTSDIALRNLEELCFPSGIDSSEMFQEHKKPSSVFGDILFVLKLHGAQIGNAEVSRYLQWRTTFANGACMFVDIVCSLPLNDSAPKIGHQSCRCLCTTLLLHHLQVSVLWSFLQSAPKCSRVLQHEFSEKPGHLWDSHEPFCLNNSTKSWWIAML